MPKLISLIFLLACTAISLRAEEMPSQKALPIEITASGETNYENGIATAHENVAIHLTDTDIYADSAEYNPETRIIRVEGHVRIYRAVTLYVGDRASYNVDTKKITATEMRTDKEPYFVKGASISSLSENAFLVSNGILTTHDSAKPDFRLRARTVRLYEKDRVVFQNVTFYIGKVPVFWFPYLYQSLNDTFSFLVSPAYLSSWGPSLLGRVSFPITDHLKGIVRLDYRARRGAALGFESELGYGKDNNSFARLRTYFIQDQSPNINRTTIPRGDLPESRYRVSLQDRTYFTDDFYGTVNLTKLSDPYVLQDFYQSEFRIDPQPDNIFALTKLNPVYSLTAIARVQANTFFEATERLPEIVLDVKRHPLFGGPIFYEGETGFASLHRSFAESSGFQNYNALRFDTFHQLLYPNTYFGWLSIVPRVGFRGTYYNQTRDLTRTLFTANSNPLVPDFLLPNPTLANPIAWGGDAFRTIANAGAEASFKLSRTWESVQNRGLGLDGLRHIVQPYTNFSYVSHTGVNPAEILQFDRYQPSTQLRPIDFPQFTSIDSIDRWTIWRMGVRNRLQTRRDDVTINWMEMDTYFDVNFDNPFDKTPYSNLFNRFAFSPVPWMRLDVGSQLPVFDKGFTEVNTSVSVQPIANMSVNLSHRYLSDSPFFANSSVYVLGGYYRLNDNWGFGISEQYEATTGVLEQQRYSVYRDLTSWVASFGALIRNNGGRKEFGVLLTFTLKALPKFSFDLNFDPGGTGQTP